jgi:excisionase family DNA binding protein
METYLTVMELAEYLKLSEQTIRRWILKREIPFCKIKNAIRFRLSEIEAWIDSINDLKKSDEKGKANSSPSEGSGFCEKIQRYLWHFIFFKILTWSGNFVNLWRSGKEFKKSSLACFDKNNVDLEVAKNRKNSVFKIYHPQFETEDDKTIYKDAKISAASSADIGLLKAQTLHRVLSLHAVHTCNGSVMPWNGKFFTT